MACISRKISLVFKHQTCLQVLSIRSVGQLTLKIGERRQRGYRERRDPAKYVEPPFDQKVLLAACEPIIQRDMRPSWEKCSLPKFNEMQRIAQIPHPLEIIYSKELKQEMDQTDFIAFYHKNSMSQEEEKLVRNSVIKKGFLYRWHNRLVLKMATEDTKFSCLSGLLFETPNTVLVIGGEKERGIVQTAKTLLQHDKKGMPGFTLMYAFAQDRILSKEQLVELSQMGSLDSLRGSVLATLNHAMSSVSSTLSHHQTLLSMNLSELAKRGTSEETSKESITCEGKESTNSDDNNESTSSPS